MANPAPLAPLTEHDILALNQCVIEMNTPGRNQQAAADRLRLAAEREDFWRYTDTILENPAIHPNLKFLVLSALRDAIEKRWLAIAEEDKAPIRMYIMQTVINWADKPPNEIPPALLLEADIALVQVLLSEWPTIYPNIINELIEHARTSMAMCTNNLNIIKILCQEVFDRGDEKLLYSRVNELSNCIREHRDPVFNFIEEILRQTNEGELVKVCLEILKYFIKWCDPQQLRRSNFFEQLCQTFLPNPLLVNEVLGLFNEIFGLPDLPEDFRPVVPVVFKLMVDAIDKLIPNPTTEAFREILTVNPYFIKILPMTLTVFLERFGAVIETPDCAPAIQRALTWMLCISDLPEEDPDSFKTCCDFWHSVALRVNVEKRNPEATALSVIYGPIIGQIQRIHIIKMERPEEITIVQDDNGNIVREQQRNTLTLILSQTMFETLGILTSVNPKETLDAIFGYITQVSQQWNPDVFNRVCWSVGAITKVLPVEEEKVFITRFLKILFDMTQRMPDPQDRAVVASGLMYVCSQYPRFLMKYREFLLSVLKKLFEFMHQEVPGVKEMAVRSFQRIAEGCKRTFLAPADKPMILGILQDLSSIICDLDDDLIASFFGSVAMIIKANVKEATRMQQLAILLEHINTQWESVMERFNAVDMDMAKTVNLLLRCNAAVAFNVGQIFHEQLSYIFDSMMNVYSSYSATANGFASSPMDVIARRGELTMLKNVKSAVLLVITNFLSKAGDVTLIGPRIVPPIIDTIVVEYGNSHQDTRVPEVLSLLEILCNKTQNEINKQLGDIFMSVFMKTVPMISQNFTDYVNFRVPFYKFLHVIVKKYMKILVSAPADCFKMVIDCITWGFQHEAHEVCVLGLDIAGSLFTSMQQFPENQAFLGMYFIPMFRDLFSTLVDTTHKCAFDNQIELLTQMLGIATRGMNIQSLAESVVDLFPNMQPAVLLEQIAILIGNVSNKMAFRAALRNFLVLTRLFSPTDPDLNRQEIDEQRQEEKRQYESVLTSDPVETENL